VLAFYFGLLAVGVKIFADGLVYMPIGIGTSTCALASGIQGTDMMRKVVSIVLLLDKFEKFAQGFDIR
jgi:hypothetical protein